MRTATTTFFKTLFVGARRATPAQQPVRELSPQQLRQVVGGETTAPRGVW
jgi:hypothetical protein